MKLEDICSKNLVLTEEQIALNRELVSQIQARLAELDLYPKMLIDGLWGRRTKSALTEFCESAHLNNLQFGKFGLSFAKALLEAKVDRRKFLDHADYLEAARFLGVNVAAIKAVVQVEAAGGGFFKDGKPKILFEAHWFDHYTKGKHRLSHPNISSARWNRNLYFGGPKEYERLQQAKALNAWAALMATSWGLGQVMGFNHRLAGYSDVESFVNAMYESEGKQLLAMCGFIKNRGLHHALKKHDWAAFARGYNGEGYRANAYDTKLASAYRQHLA